MHHELIKCKQKERDHKTGQGVDGLPVRQSNYKWPVALLYTLMAASAENMSLHKALGWEGYILIAAYSSL